MNATWLNAKTVHSIGRLRKDTSPINSLCLGRGPDSNPGFGSIPDTVGGAAVAIAAGWDCNRAAEAGEEWGNPWACSDMACEGERGEIEVLGPLADGSHCWVALAAVEAAKDQYSSAAEADGQGIAALAVEKQTAEAEAERIHGREGNFLVEEGEEGAANG